MPEGTMKIWSDPYVLVKEAATMRDDAPETVQTSAMEDAIRRAHQLVSPDLYVIERLKQSNMEPDYLNLFGSQIQEKMAALIFLAKHKLLDIEQSTLYSRDVNDAKRDLSSYVEILFRLEAVDALGIFFDFAQAQRDSRVPALWRNVSSRCLYLMSLLPQDCWPQVAAFLENRPEAQRLMEELKGSQNPQIAEPLQNLANMYQQTAGSRQSVNTPGQMMNTMPQPLYITIAQRYEAATPVSAARDEAARGVSSLLSAQDRISQAAAAGDIPSLVDWISNGSHAAMNAAFRCALSVMSNNQYINMLEQAIEHGDLEPVRMAAVVLELGNLNRSTSPQGGVPTINRLLLKLAMTEDEELSGVAKVAIHELGAVKAQNDILTVAEKAPLLAVAEEVVTVIRANRQLTMLESLLNQRPELIPAYRTARAELVELQDLTESAWACQTEDLAMIYLDQLKARKAMPELKQLTMAPNFVSELARQILTELEAEIPWT